MSSALRTRISILSWLEGGSGFSTDSTPPLATTTSLYEGLLAWRRRRPETPPSLMVSVLEEDNIPSRIRVELNTSTEPPDSELYYSSEEFVYEGWNRVRLVSISRDRTLGGLDLDEKGPDFFLFPMPGEGVKFYNGTDRESAQHIAWHSNSSHVMTVEASIDGAIRSLDWRCEYFETIGNRWTARVNAPGHHLNDKMVVFGRPSCWEQSTLWKIRDIFALLEDTGADATAGVVSLEAALSTILTQILAVIYRRRAYPGTVESSGFSVTPVTTAELASGTYQNRLDEQEWTDLDEDEMSDGQTSWEEAAIENKECSIRPQTS
ncbi:hypothetical protein DFH07DRAFT_779420 [Mycena maculata]|uniref:Uncharacterized protein n=1 Tax=Mycena maculata TaxID=230809 RepID=A0AAD7I890_9AGAR|nr:hypothetical protein DFH07DRAFT_779420 [Mycena maculata]